jgi:hypothetical protein
VSSTAPAHPGEPAAATSEVADGVFAYVQADGTWWINNTGFVVGRRGVVSIDACATERRTRAYLEVRAAIAAWGAPRAAPFWTDVDWGAVQLEPPFLTYTRSSPIPSGSSGTCTGRMRSWTAPRPAPSSTPAPRSPTWSPTTADAR